MFHPRRMTVALLGSALLLLTGCSASSSTVPAWPAPTSNIRDHAAAAGLSLLPEEGTRLHIHPHLSITVDGKAVKVPANIGIDTRRHAYSEIHTHDASGILHVESPYLTTFYLWQPLREWAGPALGYASFSSYRDGRDDNRVQLFLDGKRYMGNFRKVVLRDKQDISIAITTDGTQPHAAKRFVWPKGY